MLSNIGGIDMPAPQMMAANLKLGEMNLQESHQFDQRDKFSFWDQEHSSAGYKWMVKIDPEKQCGGKKAFKLKSEYVAPEDDTIGGPGQRHWNFKVTDQAKDGSECNIYFVHARHHEITGQKWWKNDMPNMKTYKVAIKHDEQSLVDPTNLPFKPWSCRKSWYPNNKQTCWADQAYQTCHHGNNQWAYDNVMAVGGSNKAAWELYTKYKFENGCPTCNVAKSHCKFSMYPGNKNTCWADDAFQKCHGSQKAYDQVMAKGGSNEHAYCHWKNLVDTNCEALDD